MNSFTGGYPVVTALFVEKIGPSSLNCLGTLTENH